MLKKKTYNFLRWTQRWTKTDMVYLVKGGFWLNLGQFLMIVTNLLLTIAFANLLDPKTYGTYKFVISFIAILSIPTLSGIGTALVRAVAQGNDRTLIIALKKRMKWGLLGALGGILMAIYYYIQGNVSLFLSFLILAFFIPIMNPLKTWVSYLNGKGNFKKIGQYQFFSNLINVGVILITLFITHNLLYILISYLVSLTLARLLMLFLSIKSYPPEGKEDLKSIGYGKHLSLMGILNAVALKIDTIMIFHFLGATEVAIFTFAKTPVKYLKSPFTSLSQLILPKLSKRDLGSLKQNIPKKIIRLFGPTIIIILFYILTIPYFFKFLFPQYIQSVIYSQMLAISLLTYPKTLITQTLTAHAQKKQLYILQTIVPIVKIFLFLILLPLYGIWGIIVSIIFSEFLHFTMLLIMLKRIPD